jgi:integrase/recombinase XerD
MAVTGLRRKEAIELRLSDFTGDGLQIRQTKFRKSRLVLLHSSTIAQGEGYLEARRLVPAKTDHRFVSLRGGQLAGHTVLTTFHKVCEEAGTGRTPRGSFPRLHDLRHAFTVHALNRCLVNCDQVNRHMLALTTYLGHARVESTYWYLESTPQLLHDFTTGGQR